MNRMSLFAILTVFAVSTASAASPDAEDRIQQTYLQAVKEHRAGNHKTAVKLFKRVVAKSPELRAHAFAYQVQALQAMRLWDESIEAINAEITNNPFNGELRILLSETNFNLGQYPATLDALNFAERLLGASEAVLRIRGYTLQKLNRHDEAISVMTHYLVKFSNSALVLAARAESYLTQGDRARADADIRQAYSLRPFDEAILASYARIALQMGKSSLARKMGRKCVEQFSQNLSCFESLGRTALNTKDFEKAARYFQAAVDLDPIHLENRSSLAESLALSGKPSDADFHFQTVLNMKPDYEPAMRKWSQLLRQRDGIDQLGTQIRKFYKKNPTNIWAAVELSSLLLSVGMESEVLQTMKDATESAPSTQSKLHYAHFLSLVGQHKESEAILKDLKDEKTDVHFYLAIVQFHQGRGADAKSSWQKVASDSPLFQKSQTNLLALQENESRGPASSTESAKSALPKFLDWELPSL